MKRIIGLFVVILALHGCKKNQPGTAPLQLVSPPDCITLSDYDHLTNNKDRADWLVAQGKLVCDSILYAREVEHEVLAADVNVSSSAKPYVMKWEAMETLLTVCTPAARARMAENSPSSRGTGKRRRMGALNHTSPPCGLGHVKLDAFSFQTPSV